GTRRAMARGGDGRARRVPGPRAPGRGLAGDAPSGGPRARAAAAGIRPWAARSEHAGLATRLHAAPSARGLRRDLPPDVPAGGLPHRATRLRRDGGILRPAQAPALGGGLPERLRLFDRGLRDAGPRPPPGRDRGVIASSGTGGRAACPRALGPRGPASSGATPRTAPPPGAAPAPRPRRCARRSRESSRRRRPGPRGFAAIVARIYVD